MKLSLVSLGSSVAVQVDVQALRAEDATGCFGIRPGHADFLTTLAIGVVSWTNVDGSQQHCAVRRGILRVRAGKTIVITTREAILDNDLVHLEATVLQEFKKRDEAERSSRTESHQFEIQAVREIMRYLQPESNGGRRRG